MAELGRVTRAYVSGYLRDRVHYGSLVRGEKRSLIANFNGAIPADRTIESVTWRTNQNYCVLMADPVISDRQVSVTITAQAGLEAAVKCQVTLDDGAIYNQLFVLRVQSSPWFQGETVSNNGPQVLTATA